MPPATRDGGCADGLFTLMQSWLGQHSKLEQAMKEECPTVCKLTSLLQPSAEDRVTFPCPAFPLLADVPQASGQKKDTSQNSLEKPERGDLVILGHGVQAEYRLCSAVVREVDPITCTVVVLDPSRTFSIGECMVKFADLQLVHREWRIGARVVIGGLQSSKMRHLNGLSATACQHRRYGHPCFVSQSDPSKVKLKICVHWEDPKTDSTGALLLEPRFLSPYLRGFDQRSNLQGDDDVVVPDMSWTRASEDASKGSTTSPHHSDLPRQSPRPQDIIRSSPRPVQEVPSNTLLVKSRRQGLVDAGKGMQAASSKATSELKMADRHASVSEAEGRRPLAPTCVGGFLGVLAWFVDARASQAVEEEHPTVCKLTSIIAVDGDDNAQLQHKNPPPLMPIPELSPRTEQWEYAPPSPVKIEKPEQGDLVVLGRGVLPEHQFCSAVVTQVDATHCTVAVLDDSRSHHIGECKSQFTEILPVNTDWRIGARLVIGGLQSNNMRHLNGLTVIVCPHKRYGHPCFIQKPNAPDDTTKWLTLCVRMEDPSKSSVAAVLLEPRFLSPIPRTQQPSPRALMTLTMSGAMAGGEQKQDASTATSRPATEGTYRRHSSRTSSASRTSGNAYQKQSSLTSNTASPAASTYQKQSSSTSISSAQRTDKCAVPRTLSHSSGESSQGRASVTWKMPGETEDAYLKQTSLPNNYKKSPSLTSTASGGTQKQSSLPSTASGSSGNSQRLSSDEMLQEVRDLRRMLVEMTHGAQGPRRV